MSVGASDLGDALEMGETGRNHEGAGKDCARTSVTDNMRVLFRPKFWENLTSPLFGTLSPPSETSEVSCGAGGQ